MLGATTLSPASAPTLAISSSVSGARSAAAALPARYSLATVSTNALKLKAELSLAPRKLSRSVAATPLVLSTGVTGDRWPESESGGGGRATAAKPAGRS